MGIWFKRISNFNLALKCLALGTVDRGPQIQRLNADRAGPREAELRDFRRRVDLRVVETGMPYRGVEEFMNAAEAAAGKNDLEVHVRVAFHEMPQQFDLFLSARGEIGVTALGGRNNVAIAIPEQDGLAQPGPGGNQHLVSLRRGRSFVQGEELRGPQEFHAMSRGLEAV